MKCSVQLVLQCFGDFVASCVVCRLNIPATEKNYRAPVANLVVHRAVTREVVSSRLRPDQHSGSLNN